MPGLDWRLLKAQCWQESRFREGAVSPVGAMGLCQFMPGTWKQISGQMNMPANASAFAPELSIEAAAYYMAKLRSQWSAPRPEYDRHSLALASYNAGLGNLLTAQTLCGGANLYPRIVTCLPEVTGRHSRETISYVDHIWRFWKLMLLGD
ncbi:transglycosylase SLT domain-containing protein [Thalassospira sp.]|uniref:transglycosylase SLT domain-containing protein n=1 Tax=Thalassospira sp. TaxID=1912094 RepID=UPI002623047D|nr:transglycosylase SLT domain-containing protein [Thalassospira sp.]MCH2276991.1 transglycosylase SLT domain-containing protein [Thalassospira sp.]